MRKMTDAQIQDCYKFAKDVYENTKTKAEAVEALVTAYGMNENYAKIAIKTGYNWICGERKRFVTNLDHTDYCMCMIKKDYGDSRLALSLGGLEEYINYRKSRGKMAKGYRAIHNKYSLKIGLPTKF